MKIKIEVSEDVHRRLDHLRRTGLFGKTVEETASILLRERLRDQEVASWCNTLVTPGAGTFQKL